MNITFKKCNTFKFIKESLNKTRSLQSFFDESCSISNRSIELLGKGNCNKKAFFNFVEQSNYFFRIVFSAFNFCKL